MAVSSGCGSGGDGCRSRWWRSRRLVGAACGRWRRRLCRASGRCGRRRCMGRPKGLNRSRACRFVRGSRSSSCFGRCRGATLRHCFQPQCCDADHHGQQQATAQPSQARQAPQPLAEHGWPLAGPQHQARALGADVDGRGDQVAIQSLGRNLTVLVAAFADRLQQVPVEVGNAFLQARGAGPLVLPMALRELDEALVADLRQQVFAEHRPQALVLARREHQCQQAALGLRCVPTGLALTGKRQGDDAYALHILARDAPRQWMAVVPGHHLGGNVGHEARWVGGHSARMRSAVEGGWCTFT